MSKTISPQLENYASMTQSFHNWREAVRYATKHHLKDWEVVLVNDAYIIKDKEGNIYAIKS